MPDGVTAYPLSWPAGRPRTPAGERRNGAFKAVVAGKNYRTMRPVTLTEARERLMAELDRLRATLPVLSTNLELRLDGWPRGNQREPEDTGVALYFQLRRKPIVLACDLYTSIPANIAAIAAHIEATRAIERHGVGTLDQAFAGFVQLPPPGRASWRATLGFRTDEPVSPAIVSTRRRELARIHHADAGGDQDRMAEINAAADQALAEMRS